MSSNSHVSVEPPVSGDWYSRSHLAIRILAGFEIALIIATWPLWWGGHSFPQIPLMSVLAVPQGVDRLLVVILLAACGAIVCGANKLRWHMSIRIVGLLAAVVLSLVNQHRLQAWHWLFMMSITASIYRPEYCLTSLRSILGSVYVCSALSRITPTAHQGMSAAIVDQLLQMAGIAVRPGDGGTAEFLCHALNFAELIVGLLLLIPRLRRFGILSALALHGTLLVALGPFGLRHHFGVQLWNLCFMVLIPVVFSGVASFRKSGRSLESQIFQASLCFVWVFPLSGLIGIADNWPSWQLYSTRPESWTLWIRSADKERLSASVKRHVSEPAPLEDWSAVRIDRWSLAETGSPIYPEDRFQFEVIRLIVGELPMGGAFRIEISEPHDWFWWRRKQRTILTNHDLDAEQTRFVFRQ